MPYRNMSLEDFAKYLGMDARDVRRLADRGKLPGRKVGGQWRFNRARVTEWLQQEMPALDEARIIALEQSLGMAQGVPVDDSALTVTDLLGLEGIEPALAARTRASVLHELVSLADRTGLLYDAAGLLRALQERETLYSTALPNGVAIPHPRQPMPYVSAEPLVCLARVGRGIAFGSPEGKLTDLFVLICCHDDRHHLRVLARLMRVLDGTTPDDLRQVEEPTEALELLLAKERQVVARTT